MAKGETRYQRIHRLIREGQCGLLPLDFTCPCPKRNGPDHPHSDHPGKVGFLTCRGCEHQADLYFDNRVCTHPKARQLAAGGSPRQSAPGKTDRLRQPPPNPSRQER